MWAKKISNLSDPTVTYELKIRGVPVEGTTARTRKLMLVGVLNDVGPTSRQRNRYCLLRLIWLSALTI
jgi:hypothetical protein